MREEEVICNALFSCTCGEKTYLVFLSLDFLFFYVWLGYFTLQEISMLLFGGSWGGDWLERKCPTVLGL